MSSSKKSRLSKKSKQIRELLGEVVTIKTFNHGVENQFDEFLTRRDDTSTHKGYYAGNFFIPLSSAKINVRERYIEINQGRVDKVHNYRRPVE